MEKGFLKDASEQWDFNVISNNKKSCLEKVEFAEWASQQTVTTDMTVALDS